MKVMVEAVSKNDEIDATYHPELDEFIVARFHGKRKPRPLLMMTDAIRKGPSAMDGVRAYVLRHDAIWHSTIRFALEG